MPIQDHPYIRALVSSLGRVARATLSKDGAANAGRGAQMDPAATGTLYIGQVTSSYAGGATVAVRVQADQPTLSCSVCLGVCGYAAGYGAVLSAPPVEGAMVLVFKPAADNTSGYVVCVLPQLTGAKERGAPVLGVTADMEPGTGLTVESAHIGPLRDAALLNKGLGVSGRPIDDMPGDVSLLSATGIGLRIGQLLVAMAAGEDAAVELSQVDGLLRLTGRTMHIIGPHGQSLGTNDNGRTGLEFRGSPYAHEVQGVLDPGTPRTAKGSPDNHALAQGALIAAAAQLTTVPRMQIFAGFLGSVFSAFLSVPEKGGAHRSLSDTPDDHGVVTVHADDSGRVRVSAAGDIIIERTARQPVPHRTHEQWDPTGAKAKDVKHEQKQPFDLEPDAEHADGRLAALHAEDVVAYGKKEDVRRLTEFSGDIHLQEDAKARPPPDVYGGKADPGSQPDARADHGKFRDRHALIRVGVDGTITVRANHGGEISLTGDDIHLTCPGSIYLSAGQRVVTQAGQDVAIRAGDSVDISATDHDVRMRAHRNLHLSSEAGVLLETTAESDDAGTWDKPGEDVQHRGLLIRAPKSRVFIEGRTLHLSAVKNMILESLDKAASVLTIRLARVRVATTEFMVETGGRSMLYLDRGIAGLAARTVGLFSAAGVVLTRGNKVAVIPHWADAGLDPYAQWADTAQQVHGTTYDADAWLGSYASAAVRALMRFTYRTLAQYGTDNAFYFPFGYWVYVWKTRLGRRVQEWTERTIEDTAPWPGKEHYDGTPGRELEEEQNIDATGLEKPRTSRQPKHGTIGKRKFHQFPRR